ncbi:MAG: hypothetical protein U9P79_05030 [Candidatus Cloacimonadota bacterium]|nr:hypothetical protein [Candidatus Cloacimonadota bacterium]
MKISITSGKGGTGKTILSTNLASLYVLSFLVFFCVFRGKKKEQ